MTFNASAKHLLLSLIRMSQANEIIDIFSLSAATGLSPYAALKTLVALETKGWVDARKLRVTLQGLAIGQALAGQTAGTRKRNLTDLYCADQFNSQAETMPHRAARRRSFAA